MNPHSVRVAADNGTYRARCACGWTGQPHDAKGDAHADAGAHIISHSEAT